MKPFKPRLGFALGGIVPGHFNESGGIVDLDTFKQANYLPWQNPTDQQAVNDIGSAINNGPEGGTRYQAPYMKQTDNPIESELEQYMLDPNNSWQWERYSQRSNAIDPSLGDNNFNPTKTLTGTYASNGAAARDVQAAYNQVKAQKKAELTAIHNQQQGHAMQQGGGSIPGPGRHDYVNGQLIPPHGFGQSEQERIDSVNSQAAQGRPPAYGPPQSMNLKTGGGFQPGLGLPIKVK